MKTHYQGQNLSSVTETVQKKIKNSSEKHCDDDDDDGDGGGGSHNDLECNSEGKAAYQPYHILSPGGGVAEGEVLQNSPGCSGMSESGPCKPGGVDEVLRASVDEPLRDTQEVSMTRTPMLWWWRREMEKQR